MVKDYKTDLFCHYLIEKVYDFYSDPQNLKKFKRWYKKKYGKKFKDGEK